MASSFFLSALTFVLILGIASAQLQLELQEQLSRVEENFYESTCPDAEHIVRGVVADNFRRNRTIAAGLLRLFFHDCFVQGCDGSILLDSSEDGSVVEKEGFANKNSVRGFEVIDEAKAKLERSCPGVVSCADIVALAGRDSVVLTGAPDFPMPTGRFDGRISRDFEANAILPGPSSTAQELKDNFAQQNLTVEDLVHLSGGHTIGTSRCLFFRDRLYNFSGTGQPDPLLNATYRAELRRICPESTSPSNRAELDRGSQFSFDNSYYSNLVARNGLFVSDSVLTTDSETEGIVRSFSRDPDRFQLRFRRSLVKMSKLGIKTKANGEIRKRCNVINSKLQEQVMEPSVRVSDI